MPEPAPEHPPEDLDQHATWTRSLCPRCGRFPRPANGRKVHKHAPLPSGGADRDVEFWCERGHQWRTTWREDTA